MAISCLATNELKHLRTSDWLYYSGGQEMMQNYFNALYILIGSQKPNRCLKQTAGFFYDEVIL